ncbi:AraC family transcriptional regulator [Allonocardiopsis opalescens]|uniref:AraC family transcriptional regulator n=2 Tax=Allonocardiopsis opalescens TaxID=1144618 RepID=A0A2T0Q9G4_9ACTN|nr:AraC family transcriptional regulator [Allonocardiopsis opalescens]
MRTETFSGELGEGRMVFAAPAPALRRHVVRYLGYAERTRFTRRREAPGATVPLIINFGSPLVLRPSGGAPQRFGLGLVAGLADRVGIVDSGGEQTGLQIDLTPLAARLFLDMPMGGLTNQAVPLEDVLGRGAAPVVDRLRALPGWPERFALLDEVIGARIAAARAVPPAVAEAWRRLHRAGGAVPIAALAADLGCNRSHLSGAFRHHLGLPPKTFARVLRFRAVVTDLARARTRPLLADLAARHGYADQAHLNRDFLEFAGITPTDHLRRSASGHGVVDG